MIQLFRQGNAQFKLDSRNPLNLRCVTKAQLERKAMEQDAVAITLLSVAPCGFNYRDYIIVDGRPYFLNLLPKTEKTDKRKFSYELTFEGGMYELGRVAYTMAGLHGWDYIGSLDEFCKLIVNEMNRNSLVGTMGGHLMRSTGKIVNGKYEWRDTASSNTYYYSQTQIPANGDMLYTLNNLPHALIYNVGGGWTLDFEQEWNGKEYINVPTEEKHLTYDNHTCLAVMQDLVSQWEDWEFAIDVRVADLCNLDSSIPTQCGGRIILRQKRTVSQSSTGIFLSGINTTHLNMAFGKKGGISKITREHPDGSNLPSRIYFYGGTQNLPTTYRNTRLCLPSVSKEKSYIDTGFNDNAACEAVKVFDDIFPACQQFAVTGAGMSFGRDDHFTVSMFGANFFDIFAKWKAPNTSPQPEYGSYEEWLLFYGTGDSELDLNRYNYYYYNGNTSGLRWDVSDDLSEVIASCRQQAASGLTDFQYIGYLLEYTSPYPTVGEPERLGQVETATRTANITIRYIGGGLTSREHRVTYSNQVITYTFTAVESSEANFPKSCYLLGDVTITFQTGDLAGHRFKVVGFDNSIAPLWYAIELECEGVETVLEDEPIRYFPNEDIMCKSGDKFIVDGCLMPASYVYANFGSGGYDAETMLEMASKSYIDELASKIKVGVEIAQDFIIQHNAVFRLYDKIQITDNDVLGDANSLYYRVDRLIYDLMKNSYKVEIDDGKGISPWSAVSQYLAKLKTK